MQQTKVETFNSDCLIFPYNQLSSLKHIHTYFEIIVPCRGRVAARLNDREYAVDPGEILVVFPGVVHSYDIAGSVEGTALIFSEKMLSDPESEWMQMQPSRPVLKLSEQHPDVGYCLDRLVGMAAFSESDEPLAKAYLSLVFVWLITPLGLEASPGSASKDLLYRALLYMSQNLAKPLNIRTTAHELGVNSYYLSHVLNRQLNMGFRAYLNGLRISRARRYLRVTSWPIEEIARTCGFSNLRTFDRVFSERCGCTPREFRNATTALRRERKEKTDDPARSPSDVAADLHDDA